MKRYNLSTYVKRMLWACQFFTKWSTIASGFIELDLKLIWKNKGLRTAKTTVKQKNKLKKLDIQYIKMQELTVMSALEWISIWSEKRDEQDIHIKYIRLKYDTAFKVVEKGWHNRFSLYKYLK